MLRQSRAHILRLFAPLKLVEAVLIRHYNFSLPPFSPAKQFIMFSFLVQEKMKGFAGSVCRYDSYIYIYYNLFLFGMLYLTAFFATALTGFHKYFFAQKQATNFSYRRVCVKERQVPEPTLTGLLGTHGMMHI